MRQYAMGIDIGTTGVKTILISDDGQLVAEETVAHDLLSVRPGWAEERAEIWWENAVESVRRILADHPDKADKIRGIGCSGMVPALVFLDEEGNPVRNTIQQNDARAVEQLRQAVGEVVVDRGVLEQLKAGEKALSPGMKYKHYAPAAEVILLEGGTLPYRAWLREHAQPGDWAICFEEALPLEAVPARSYGRKADHAAQAQKLFLLLRELDRLEAKRIFVHSPQRDGVGLAVYNRLARAAAFRVVELPGAGE